MLSEMTEQQQNLGLPTPDPAPTFAPQRPFLAHKSVNICDVGQAWKTHEQEHTSYFAVLTLRLDPAFAYAEPPSS